MAFSNAMVNGSVFGSARPAKFMMVNPATGRAEDAVSPLRNCTGFSVKWRREGLAVLVGRLPASTGPHAGQTLQILYALTSFETFDTLAGPDRGLADALPLVTRLADAILSMQARELPG